MISGGGIENFLWTKCHWEGISPYAWLLSFVSNYHLLHIHYSPYHPTLYGLNVDRVFKITN
jgi:hypothetical protein